MRLYQSFNIEVQHDTGEPPIVRVFQSGFQATGGFPRIPLPIVEAVVRLAEAMIGDNKYDKVVVWENAIPEESGDQEREVKQ